MTGFIRSKLGQALATLILITATVAVPLASSIISSHAASPAGATSQSTHQLSSFSPSGQGSVVPRNVSTFTTPQIQATGHGSVANLPGPGDRANVPSPQNVVRVPVPVNLNLTTNVKFEGQSQNGFEPSDSNGAGGLNNYVETVDEQLAVYSRSGSQQFKTSFKTWFGVSGSIFDPVVQWDKSGQRFLFIVTTGSSLLLSVAQQTSGIGHYCTYTFPTPSGDFADYEKLGVDTDGVYFTVNLYTGNPPVFTSNELFFANRTQLETCLIGSYTTWTTLKNPECYSPPPPAKQKGSSGTIDAGDNRLYQANFLNGMLTLDTVGSFNFGDGNGPVGIVEWFVLNASSSTVSSQGSFGTPGFWLFYPATILNSAGHKLFVFDASGNTIYPSIWYVNQTLSGTQTLASGAGHYGTIGTARWGDYQSAWLDPTTTSPNSIWITGQYAKANNLWGTKVGRVTT